MTTQLSTILLTLLLTLPPLIGFSQNVEWAANVIEVSSEYSYPQNSALQALGRPNVLPRGGESPNAWMARKPNRTDFIKVGFRNPIQIKQVAIGESLNPGAVSKVFAYDSIGTEYLLYELQPQPLELVGRVLNINVDQTPYTVHAVKVVISGGVVPGYNGIDAIGISSSQYPITAGINVASNLNPSLRVERVGPAINSEYAEYGPILTPDGKQMYFSRLNHPDNTGGKEDPEDIWVADLDEQTGEWKEAKNIGRPLNNDQPNFINSVSSDGNTLVLLLGNIYKGDKTLPGISFSRKANGEFQEPTPIEIVDDYNLSPKANYYISNDLKTLLMAVQREDSNGERDLYVSFLEEDSSYSVPLNLGNVVNSGSEEAGPFLSQDGKTLFFSSTGFSSYGGMDIYLSRRLDDSWTNWTEPENLGNAINSDEDDIFFNMPEEGNYAYFVKSEGQSNTDIFRVSLPLFYEAPAVIFVQGNVFQKTNDEDKPLKASIEVQNLTANEVIDTLESDDEGVFEILLPAGNRYGFTPQADMYLPISDNIDLSADTSYREMTQDLYLVSKTYDQPIEINNVFFAFNSSQIQSDSRIGLNRLSELLKENDDLSIRIIGHTDNVGSDDYNLRLSRERAAAIRDYLVSNGISDDRLSVEGKGESSPVASNNSDSGRKQNRRVEFVIDR
ncbi:MAG: OmpA family protein [Cyclobacteriaceae bacterium]